MGEVEREEAYVCRGFAKQGAMDIDVVSVTVGDS